MKLNPVVHTNGSLSFGASGTLNNIIWGIKAQLLGILFFQTFIFFSWSLKLFIVSGKTINLIYLAAEIIFTAIAAFVSYLHINRTVPVVVKIGNKVSIANDMISVITFTYNWSFWRQKPLYCLEFKISELRIRKAENPLKFTQALNNKIFKLWDKEKEAFIVFDYFDPLLKERLMEIMAEVSPPELLFPGRFRHH